MMEKKLNNLNKDNLCNLADKAISDEELENVSGGAGGGVLCAVCFTPMNKVNGVWVCPNGH